jgi:hypothetical protein
LKLLSSTPPDEPNYFKKSTLRKNVGKQDLKKKIKDFKNIKKITIQDMIYRLLAINELFCSTNHQRSNVCV